LSLFLDGCILLGSADGPSVLSFGFTTADAALGVGFGVSFFLVEDLSLDLRVDVDATSTAADLSRLLFRFFFSSVDFTTVTSVVIVTTFFLSDLLTTSLSTISFFFFGTSTTCSSTFDDKSSRVADDEFKFLIFLSDLSLGIAVVVVPTAASSVPAPPPRIVSGIASNSFFPLAVNAAFLPLESLVARRGRVVEAVTSLADDDGVTDASSSDWL
jgi:hypothetical protein